MGDAQPCGPLRRATGLRAEVRVSRCGPRMGEGDMTEGFGNIGCFARVGPAWYKARRMSFDGRSVGLFFVDRVKFDRWSSPGDVERRWDDSAGRGSVRVETDYIDEVVDVSRHGRYRGLPVYQRGLIMDGHVVVAPEDPHPLAGEDLGFEGHPRFERNKEVSVEEFEDVIEEVRVTYRRGQGWIRG